MMLRVRPAQFTMIVVSRSISFAMSVMRSASSPPGTLRPPGMQKAPELLRRARVEDDELLAILDALREVLALDLGHVVHDLDLLAEVLARHVHAPLGLEPVGNPAIDAAVEHRHLTIAQALERRRGEPGAPAVVVAHDDRRALKGTDSGS
jgi:hypothetical protein